MKVECLCQILNLENFDPRLLTSVMKLMDCFVSYCNRKSKQAFISFLYTFAVFFSYNVSHMCFYRCGFPFFGLTADVIEGK